MAELVGVYASSHAPLIIRGWKDVKPANQRELTSSLTELGRRIKAARPDVLIEISPDHWVNFFINNLPGICVGVGEEHEGPAEPWMKDFPFKKIAGHPKLANHILQTALERDFEPSVSHHLTLDHGFCIPLWRGGLDPLPPIVPIIINDLEPPYPSVRRCLQWGTLLAEAIRTYPGDIRVAILATGGLSHSIGEPTKLWAPWLLEGDLLEEGKRDAMRLLLADQEAAGIDIVTDGEQTRRHFVTTFIESLKGVDFEHKRTVRIRNRYDADVPVVVGPVRRGKPVFVEDVRFLRGQTKRPIKLSLPGPMTMVDTLYDNHYRSREKLAREFAAILNQEALVPERAGADVIQFDEPAFNVYMDEVAAWGLTTLEAAAAGLRCKTAVHICYGYGIKANIDWKKTLGSEWRQYESTFPLLARSKIDQVSLECANSHVPLELLALLRGKDVLVGAIDVANDAVEKPEEVAATIRSAMRFVPPEKLYPCTNCGMVPLAREVALGKLNALASGAALVRPELGT